MDRQHQNDPRRSHYGQDDRSDQYGPSDQQQQWSEGNYRQPGGGDWQGSGQHSAPDDWSRGYSRGDQPAGLGSQRYQDRQRDEDNDRPARGRRMSYASRYGRGGYGASGVATQDRYAQVGDGYSGHAGFGLSDYDRDYDTAYRYSGPGYERENRGRAMAGRSSASLYSQPYTPTGGRFARDYGRDEEDDRGFFAKSRDEIASWFGDEDAAHRREMDHRGRGPSGYTRLDERIREDVCDRLTEDWAVDASDISVSVASGEVTLEGHVDSRQAKRRAEDCVERISGVGHVQNNLRVRDRAAGTGTGTGATSLGSGSAKS